MKYLGGFVFLALLLGVYFFFFATSPQDLIQPVQMGVIPTTTISPTNLPLQEKKVLFVPYWSMAKDTKVAADEYDTVIYFGIAPEKGGINKNDDGYKKILQFTQNTGANQKLLTIRMIDSKLNSAILEDTEMQKGIIDESIQIAKANDFDGVVLDFEISALAFDSVVKKITSFYQLFSAATKKENFVFAVTLYGDAFYRARPYDIEKIGKVSDHVYLMTYDFSKSRENPGPNFPLTGKDTYGYDITTMLSDFKKIIPAQKLTVVFGLFGYDWTLDDKKQSVGFAESLSSLEIKKKFLDGCIAPCGAVHDPLSFETKITYTDEVGKNHVVWFEDEASALKKEEAIKKQGVGQFGYWAYSYF